MPSPDGAIDLRSDTVTTPTPAMRRAMADAPVGDDLYGEDPTVNHLQELAAAMVGKDAAVYVPSGTMGNQLALRLLARPATEVLCSDRAHLRQYEAAAAARNAGVQFRNLSDLEGTFTGVDVDLAVEGAAHHLPPISLVAIENTHMPSGGRAWHPAQVADVGDACRAHRVPLHCDGARIFNAAVALGIDATRLCAPADTVMFCLSKGLGAPVGSLLCGPAEVMAEARAERSRLGGGMRQAGIIAAAGIIALEQMVERLADDHARARRLADALAECFEKSVDPDEVETNIVVFETTAVPPGFLDALAARGIRAGTIDQHTYRFTTHKDIDDADIDRVVTALREIARDG
jgi:threonine aldolase